MSRTTAPTSVSTSAPTSAPTRTPTRCTTRIRLAVSTPQSVRGGDLFSIGVRTAPGAAVTISFGGATVFVTADRHGLVSPRVILIAPTVRRATRFTLVVTARTRCATARVRVVIRVQPAPAVCRTGPRLNVHVAIFQRNIVPGHGTVKVYVNTLPRARRTRVQIVLTLTRVVLTGTGKTRTAHLVTLYQTSAAATVNGKGFATVKGKLVLHSGVTVPVRFIPPRDVGVILTVVTQVPGGGPCARFTNTFRVVLTGRHR